MHLYGTSVAPSKMCVSHLFEFHWQGAPGIKLGMFVGPCSFTPYHKELISLWICWISISFSKKIRDYFRCLEREFGILKAHGFIFGDYDFAESYLF